MAPVALDEIRDSFRNKDRAELEELVLASTKAHAWFCSLAGFPSEEHAPDAELRQRIKSKSTDDIVDMLARQALASRAAGG
jgi:hypothetical protein